jgi:hypothetical protein
MINKLNKADNLLNLFGDFFFSLELFRKGIFDVSIHQINNHTHISACLKVKDIIFYDMLQ